MSRSGCNLPCRVRLSWHVRTVLHTLYTFETATGVVCYPARPNISTLLRSRSERPVDLVAMWSNLPADPRHISASKVSTFHFLLIVLAWNENRTDLERNSDAETEVRGCMPAAAQIPAPTAVRSPEARVFFPSSCGRTLGPALDRRLLAPVPMMGACGAAAASPPLEISGQHTSCGSLQDSKCQILRATLTVSYKARATSTARAQGPVRDPPPPYSPRCHGRFRPLPRFALRARPGQAYSARDEAARVARGRS